MFKKIGKLNNIAMLCIGLLFVTFLVILGCLLIPEKDYGVRPDYEHRTGYEEIEVYETITYAFYEEGGERKRRATIRYSVSNNRSPEDLTDGLLTLSRVSPMFYTKSKSNYFMFEQTQNRETPYASSTMVYGSDFPAEVFFSIDYYDKDELEQTITSKETMFETPKNGRRFKGNNAIKIGDATFNYQAIKSSDGNNITIPMHIEISANKHFHVDMQSWILCENGDIYDLCGVYGFTQKSEWTTSNVVFPKDLKPKTLLAKMVVYYEGEEYEILYKIEIDSLPAQYYNFVDSYLEAKR